MQPLSPGQLDARVVSGLIDIAQSDQNPTKKYVINTCHSTDTINLAEIAFSVYPRLRILKVHNKNKHTY